MKTIFVANSPTGKSLKKVLSNRSRSGNQILLYKTDSFKTHLSPFRNSIGLKNYPDTPHRKANLLKIKPNHDYYQL